MNISIYPLFEEWAQIMKEGLLIFLVK